VGAGFLVDELEERGLVAAAVVVLGSLTAGGEELDGRVRGDALGGSGVLAVAGLGVNLGDQDVGFGGKVSG